MGVYSPIDNWGKLHKDSKGGYKWSDAMSPVVSSHHFPVPFKQCLHPGGWGSQLYELPQHALRHNLEASDAAFRA